MRGWLAVNVFLLVMIGFAAGFLFLALAGIRSLVSDPALERTLFAIAAVLTLVATGFFGKWLLALIERRNRG